jgi:hypothetical protein
MEHPLYLLNLPPKDIYLFLKSKYTLKGQRFQEFKDFQKNVTEALNRKKQHHVSKSGSIPRMRVTAQLDYFGVERLITL